VQIALDAAGGKNVEVFSPTIGRQLRVTKTVPVPGTPEATRAFVIASEP